MGTANVVAMTAQPSSISYLCFEIAGILDTLDAELGDTVKAITYQKLCDQLKAGNVNAADPSRLKGDSNGVASLVNHYSMASLRNEDRKAALDSAINTRQNIFFSKYANSAAVISTIRAYYWRTSPASKPNLLNILSDIAEQQASDLQGAYMDDDLTGVVKQTNSNIDSQAASNSNAKRWGKFYQESVGRDFGSGAMLPNTPPVAWEGCSDTTWNTSYESKRFVTKDATASALTFGTTYEQSNNASATSGSQWATHFDYEYRTPYLEARARHNRANISLMDQKFQSYMFEQNMPYLEKIFANELRTVDNDVYQLQVALLRSFIISPVPGVVTGVYKNPGDSVSAGEPVMRVEDNGNVHLVATLVHYGPIALGGTATVTTTLGGAANPATSVTGSIVSARGRASGGRWDVVVKVNNIDGSGNYILPLRHCFDADFTQVTIV
jgi:hypothetical protein